MILLNINFTSLWLQKEYASDEQKPVAVMGRFYCQLFRFVEKLINEIIANTDESEETLEVEHYFGSTFVVKEGDKQYKTTESTCSCGEKNCRHSQAVKKHKNNSRINLPLAPVRVKSNGLRKLLAESASNNRYYI